MSFSCISRCLSHGHVKTGGLYVRIAFSFANFTSLINEEGTRAFLAIQVGAGFDNLRRLTQSVDERLSSLHLPSYYDPPIFHASIAWNSPTLSTCKNPCGNSDVLQVGLAASDDTTSSSMHCNPSASHGNSDVLEAALPVPMLDFINQSHGTELRREIIEARSLVLKIGQEVSYIPLNG